MSIVNKSEILLPKNVDFQKWAVIACDQFTSQASYWEKLSSFVGDAPSTLKITYPEIYLNENREERVAKINATMNEYLSGGIFESTNSFVLVERTVQGGKKRVSLVVSVDLESYDYHRVLTGIRATEDTILERLPVRISIRKNAPIELPHIILLMDDKDKNIIEPLYQNKDSFRKLYDFDLNMDGGHIAGYEITCTDQLIEKFDNLTDVDRQNKMYGFDAKIAFAVGDGNHSMATAKEHWNSLKQSLSDEEKLTHSARFCLVEILNIYDDGLYFEPIHRVVFPKNEDSFIEGLKNALSDCAKINYEASGKIISLNCPKSSAETIKSVQEYIEDIMESGQATCDYVHGVHHVEEVVKSLGGIGILMPEFSKEELFNYVINVGNLPKKAFSIGTAENKKYYLEAKRIK